MYFNGVIDDMIKIVEIDGIPPESDSYAQYQNINKAKRSGYEISGKYWIDNVSLGLSYEHLNIYDDETKEKVTPSADKIRIISEYKYNPWEMKFAGEVSHWFKPDQNPEFIMSRGEKYYKVNKSYTQANLRAIWKPKKSGFKVFDDNLELVFGINNIFDKQYRFANGYLVNARVGKGRNFFVNMKLAF